ncbi:MAG TPA: patatin-like phospholipase family protein [Gaiellaceae bacterium]|nr:patatin-like phospholipase family protein [Gaiellaceae bacterium]
MSRRTHAGHLSIFEGLPPEELARLLATLETRVYPAGAIVIGEGDRIKEVFIAQSGSAEVVIAAEDGTEHTVGRVVPGGTIGEISVLTGQPAVATVRAVADFEAVVVTESQAAELVEKFPRIYRNLATILAERLARTDRLAIGKREGHLIALEGDGAPPLLGYALACSIAWHTRERTLLLVLAGEDPDPDLVALATTSSERPWRSGRGADEIGADLMIASDHEAFGRRALPATLEALFHVFHHIVVQRDAAESPLLARAQRVRLEPIGGAGPSTPSGHLTIRAWSTAPTHPHPDADRLLEVPALTAEDESELRAGLLSKRSAAGRGIGWAARDLTGLKVGLALGAGSVRGYAHVGAIQVLSEAGLDFDYIAGTSVGAAVAGLLALGNDHDQIAGILDEFSPSLFRLKLPYTSLLSDRGMRSYLRSMAPDVLIEDLDTPLALVAADVVTQRELVLRRGLLWQAVLASIAIPGVYPAQKIGPHIAVDGGVLNPLPVNVAAEMGAGTVIAVKLGGGSPMPEQDVEATPESGRPPAVLGVLMRSIDMMQRGIATQPTDATVLTIAPKLDPTGVGLRNMQDGRRYIEDGAEATQASLARISAALPWLRA